MKEIKMIGRIKNRAFIFVLIVLVLVIFFHVIKIINLKQFEMMSDEEMYFSNSASNDKKDLIHNFNQQIPNRKYVYIDLGANNGKEI